MIIEDVLIVGAGPAGMTAALYAKKANKNVLILDKSMPGGRIRSTYQIDNYLGFGQVNAEELVQKMINHITDSNIRIEKALVTKIERIDSSFVVHCEKTVYYSKAIILATGTKPKLLGVENEEMYTAKGISYCAVCDGRFFEGENVIMIGGGDSALEECLYLVELAKRVTIIHEMERFTASESIVEKVLKHDRIDVLLNTSVIKFEGHESLEGVWVLDKKTDLSELIPCAGAFVYVGNNADTTFLSSFMKTDQTGYIKVNQEMATQIPGVFACGDVTKKDYRFIVTAISDGAIAALSAVKYIDHLN